MSKYFKVTNSDNNTEYFCVTNTLVVSVYIENDRHSITNYFDPKIREFILNKEKSSEQEFEKVFHQALGLIGLL